MNERRRERREVGREEGRDLLRAEISRQFLNEAVLDFLEVGEEELAWVALVG